MTSMVKVGASGRTGQALAKQPSDSAPLQSAQADTRCGRPAGGAISRVEGEGACTDDASTSTTEIARASTRFEMRIRARNDSGEEIPENVELLHQLDEASKMVAFAKNKIVRWLYVRDATWLDEHPYAGQGLCEWAPTPIRERRKGSHKGEIAPAPLSSLVYELCRADSRLDRLDGTVLAALGRDTVRKWCGERFDALVRMTRGVPHFKEHQPIRVPSASAKLVALEDGSALLSLRVVMAREGGKTINVRLVPRDEWQRDELRALTSGEWKRGEVVVDRHATKRGTWYVRMTYTRLVEMSREPGVVAIRRGMKNLIVGASSNGDVHVLDNGRDLMAFNAQMRARRRGLGRRQWEAGRGARGHGTRRNIAPLMDLADKQNRWNTDRCKRVGVGVVAYAQQQRASVVLLEDMSLPKDKDTWWLVKSWPWHQLALAIISACERAGLRVVIVAGRSRTMCPVCDHRHVKAPVDRWRTWTCAACGMQRSVEQVDVLNMLAMNGANAGVAKAEHRRKSAVLALAAGAKKGGARKAPAKGAESQEAE